MVRMAIWFYAGMLGLAYGISFFLGWGDLRHWFPVRSVGGIFLDIGMGVLVGLLVVVVSRFGMERLVWGKQMMESFVRVLGGLRPRDVLLLAFLSGIAEEALFRTTLQPFLGVGWTALLFGLVHTGPQKHYLLWTLFAMGFGLLIGGIVWWHPGLWLPAAAHITVNAMNLAKIANAPSDLAKIANAPSEKVVEGAS